MALINASRPRGLSAILPHADQTFEPEVRERSEWEREEPMLPLVSTWYEGNFSLNSVVRPGQDHWTGESGDLDRVKLREFCVKLLSRYTYSVGKSFVYPSLLGSLLIYYQLYLLPISHYLDPQ